VRDFFSYFRLFLSLAQWKFSLLLLLFLSVGLFDGIGIVMFFPLLEQMQVGSRAESNGLLDVFAAVLSWLGLSSFGGILMFIVVVFVFKFFASFGQTVAVTRIARDLYRELAQRLLVGISAADYAKMYLKTSTGFVANALTREIRVFLAAFSHYAGILAGAVFVLVYLAFSFLLDPWITLFAVVIGGLLFFALRTLTWISRREGIEVTRVSGVYQEVVVQFMQYYKYLKATHRFPRVAAHASTVVNEMTRAQEKLSVIGGFIHAIPEPIAVVVVAVLLYFSVGMWHGSFGLVAVLLLLLYRTVMRMMSLQSEWNSFFSASGALKVIPEMLDSIERDKEHTGTRVAEAMSLAIELKGVHYAYGEHLALRDVTVSIPRQSTVALVGMSGGGKSTLVDMVTGILQPDQGCVTYDGVSYKDLDLNTLRERIGYVTQEITIFNDTISQNITFFEPENGVEVRARVVDACERAQCRGFIEALPQQYETRVGDRGINLSVGQRQRIAIARELYRDPEILIFDEATSALDSESERAIQKSIESLKGSKTMILIAHRLSTIKHADRLYVIEQGRVVEEGTFTELYQNPQTRFRRMCDLQSFEASHEQ